MLALVATNVLNSTRKEYKLNMNTEGELVYLVCKYKRSIEREK